MWPADACGVHFPPPVTYVGGIVIGWLLERVAVADHARAFPGEYASYRARTRRWL